jgi:uncharacterized CHY-type Zn-finger protein
MSTARCDECYKAIKDKSVTAMNKKYHPECFVCAHCKKPFPGGKFVVHKDKPLCPHDFDNLCAKCSKVIDEEFITLNNNKYHAGCFVCNLCRTSLAGKTYFTLDDQIYCKNDYELEKRLKGNKGTSSPSTQTKQSSSSSDNCAGCNQDIDGDSLKYGGKKFHEWCFKCSHCKLMITTKEKFFDGKQPGTVVCNKCNEFLCEACGDVIKAGYVTFSERKFHEACFKCTKCKRVLSTKDFYSLNSKPYCEADYKASK